MTTSERTILIGQRATDATNRVRFIPCQVVATRPLAGGPFYPKEVGLPPFKFVPIQETPVQDSIRKLQEVFREIK